MTAHRPAASHGRTSPATGGRPAGGARPPSFSAHEPLLEIEGLCVNYGVGESSVRAVSGADLVLHRSEVLGLAGESGSGKSTLAYSAIRLLRPPGIITGGQVRYHPAPGQTVDLLAAGEEELRGLRWSHIAVVMQSAMNALNPVLPIEAQLTDVLRAHEPAMHRERRRERATELLDMVGIASDRLSSYPHELSGGMRQRVMIAMALALEPRIVIMDEPTTALDVVTQREILEELIGLRERLGFAVLFITHDLSLLVEVADSIAVMYAGRIMERASARSLFLAPRHPYSLGLIHSFPPLHGPHRDMVGIPGSPPNLKALPSGCVFHPRCGFAFDRCRTESPPLLTLAGRREAACWKQEGSVPVPPELDVPEPGYGAPSAGASGAAQRTRTAQATARPPAPQAPPASPTPAGPPVHHAQDSQPAAPAAASTAATERLRSKP